jgi:hypothetical protein
VVVLDLQRRWAMYQLAQLGQAAVQPLSSARRAVSGPRAGGKAGRWSSRRVGRWSSRQAAVRLGGHMVGYGIYMW